MKTTKTVDEKKLKLRLKRVDELRAELKTAEKSAAKDIMSLLKLLMKNNPLLLGMRWNQYTPHFNDGDACEFGVHGPYFKFVDSVNPEEKDENGEVDDSQFSDSWLEAGQFGELNNKWFDEKADILNHKEITALKKTVNEATEVFDKLSFMEVELKDMFGDGYQITVTADGIESEDYGHD